MNKLASLEDAFALVRKNFLIGDEIGQSQDAPQASFFEGLILCVVIQNSLSGAGCCEFSCGFLIGLGPSRCASRNEHNTI